MPTTSTIKDKTFLFTGTLTEFTRHDAEELVKANGGKVLSGVTAKLNFLVVGSDAGSKLTKAQQLGTVTILTEQEFMALLSNDTSAGSTSKKKDKPAGRKAFQGKNLLDIKTAKKSIDSYVDFDAYDSIDPKAAALLATLDEMIVLDGIQYLDVESARALAKHVGEDILSLGGLTELDADVAAELVKHNGPLHLSGLTTICDDVAEILARMKAELTISTDFSQTLTHISTSVAKLLVKCNHDREIDLSGLKTLSLNAAKELAHHNDNIILGIADIDRDLLLAFDQLEADLCLWGLTTISDNTAQLICKLKAGVSLPEDFSASLKSISPSIAKMLVKCNPSREIKLGSLTTFSAEAAKELARHTNTVSLGLTDIESEHLRLLSNVSLRLDNVGSLSAKQLSAVSSCKKGISLNGLRQLDLASAEYLVNVRSHLELTGVQSITDDVAKVLATYKGILHLGCTSLSETSAINLGRVKRTPGKNELHLPNIQSTADVAGNGHQHLIKDGITVLRDFPKLDFNPERVVGICYALKGGVDYAWDISTDEWEDVKNDGQEFATFREIAKQNLFSTILVEYFPIHLRSSVDFYSALANSCSELPIDFIAVADAKIISNKELMLRFLNLDQGIGTLLKYVTSKLRNDKEFVIRAVKARPDNFQYASDKLRDDRDVVNTLLTSSWFDQLEYASSRYKSDRAVARTILSQYGSALKYFSAEIKGDKELVKLASNSYPDAIKYATDDLLADKDFILSLQYVSIEYVHKSLLNNKSFVLQAIDNISRAYLHGFTLSISGGPKLSDKQGQVFLNALLKHKIGPEAAAKLLMLSGSFDRNLLPELAADITFAKMLVAKNAANLEHIPDEVRKNKELISYVNKIEDRQFDTMTDEETLYLIRYSDNIISDSFSNKRELTTVELKRIASIVTTVDDAILLLNQSKTFFKHLSAELRGNESIASVACIRCPENAKYFTTAVLTNISFLENLLHENPSVFQYLPKPYAKNKELIQSVLLSQPSVFSYIDKALQVDTDIINVVVENGSGRTLECLDAVPNTSLCDRDFALRVASKGYCLKHYRNDKEIVTCTLKHDPYADVGNMWDNDLDIVLLAKGGNSWRYASGLNDPSSPVYNRPNLFAIKFLERISNCDADNLDVDAIDFIRASGYDCFERYEIPRQDYEHDDYEEEEYEDDDYEADDDE